MKSINELPIEELRSLLSFTTTSGTTYFYCNIEIIALQPEEAIIMYKGTKYSTERELGERLIEGKLIYDAYALTMQQDKAEELLQSKATEVLRNMFDERVDIATDVVNTTFNDVAATFSQALDTLNNATATSAEIDKLTKKLEKTIERFDVSNVQERLKQKVREVVSIKEDMTDAKEKFDEVTATLKTLFK